MSISFFILAFPEARRRSISETRAPMIEASPDTADKEEPSNDEPAILIVEMGSYNVRAGFSCYDEPSTIFRNIRGVRSARVMRTAMTGFGTPNIDETYIGNACLQRTSVLDFNYMIRRDVNICTEPKLDWNMLEEVWHHIFYNELQVHFFEYFMNDSVISLPIFTFFEFRLSRGRIHLLLWRCRWLRRI